MCLLLIKVFFIIWGKALKDINHIILYNFKTSGRNDNNAVDRRLQNKTKTKKHFKSQKYDNMYVHCTKMVNKTVNRDGGCLI